MPRIRLALVAALLPLVMVTVAHSAGAQSSAQAAEPAACKKCAHNLGTNEHWFTNECEAGTSSCYDCHAFNSCHGNTQPPYTCGYYHWECGVALAARARVESSLRSTDALAMVLVAAEQLPTNVRIVAGYVVVRGCNGAIASAYRLPRQDGFAYALESAGRSSAAPASLVDRIPIGRMAIAL